MRPRGKVPTYLQGQYIPEYVKKDIKPQSAGVPLMRPDLSTPNIRTKGGEVKQVKAAPMPAHVGVHQEQAWTNNQNVDNQDENDYVDVNSLQGINPLDPQSEGGSSDSETWLRANQEEQEKEEPQQQEDTCLKINEYALVYENKTLLQTSDVQELKRNIEHILFEYDVKLSDLVVYKRLELDFGVQVKL